MAGLAEMGKKLLLPSFIMEGILGKEKILLMICDEEICHRTKLQKENYS